MPKLNLRELLSDRLKDLDNKDDILEALSLDEVQRTIDEQYVNPIVKKTKEEVLEKSKDEIRQTAVNEFISGLKLDGVENVDAFKAYTKRLQATTEEKDEIISRYEQEINEIKPKYEETISTLKRKETLERIADAGFNRKYAEDVYTIAQNKVSEDKSLEDVLEEMKKDYKMFVSKAEDSGSYHPENPEAMPKPEDEEERWRKEAGLK